jgi:hypothetical protein
MGITTTTQQRTLEELRRALMIRTGAAAGVSFGYPYFDQFLNDAQSQLYEFVDWKHLVTENIQPLQVGERWYDLPDDCNLERIRYVGYRNLNTSQWYRLKYGIDDWMRSINTQAFPYRYMTRWNPAAPANNVNPIQIELYPVVSSVGQLRVEYIKRLGRFTEPGDRCTLPDNLVLMHALYNVKLDKGRPDANAIGQQLESLLMQVRSDHRQSSVIRPKEDGEMLPEDRTYLYPPQG